jgi:urease subunit alpha
MSMGDIDAQQYVSVHGPRVGDRVHLGDSGLLAQVEFDS